MHLRGIKLRGFKSFPEPVELTFEPGVSVVVGPNGSGKSNIADSIVWAAGSLSPSELRADKPDDVIFAGAAGKPAGDHCEVELLFDNSDGQFEELPYSEISIMRRLHRGGEGQYLLNRTPVRRIDLVELLADIGLGGAMHSIIGQGRVEAVLSSKPTERRELIEEAAGLGKFKRRRHRAELKLARVATEVERARDLEAEVKKRLRPLALQATAAERAEKLAGEIAGLRARLATMDLEACAERLAEAEERRTAAQLARRSAQERLEALLEQREAAEEELADAAGTREAVANALYRLRSSTERVGLRREAAQSLVAELGADLREAQAAAAPPGPEVDALRVTATEAAQASAAAAHERDAALARARVAWAKLVAAERHEHARAAAEVEALLSQRAERDAALKLLYELQSRAERVSVRRESVTTLRDELETELAEAEEIAGRGGPSPAELERAANEAAAAARARAAERDTLAEQARAARERLAALERSVAEREGIPPAARTLSEDGERIAMTLLMVHGGAERAVAAALAWRASALMAETPEHAVSLLERARQDGLGSLGVVLPRARAAGEPPVDGARPLRELVAGDEAAVALLDGAWLVPQESLLDARHGLVVTAEGHAHDADRGELWFAGETAESVLLELDARRRALASESERLAAEAARVAAEADSAAASAEQAESAYAEVATLRRLPDPTLLQRLLDAAARVERSLAAAVGAAGRLEEPLRTRSQGDAGPEGLEVEARRTAAHAAERLAVAERTLTRLGGAPEDEVEAEGDRAPLEADAKEALSDAERAREAATAAAAAASAAQAALAEVLPRSRSLDALLLTRVLAAAGRLETTLTAATTTAERLEAPLRARVDAGSVRTGELAARLRELGQAEADLRRGASEAAERASAVDVEIARVEAERDEAQRRLDEAAVEPAETEEGRDELAARVERLERRREQLGAVNPFAKEEYEREKERLEELSAQRADLEASLDELEKLRAELTETVERRFAETFEAVSAHFEEVAATLFPGGHGKLFMTEPEEEGDGEPGIEVELKPAGKKVTRLSLLSGGEKSLGAISFLFALFLARPCPFYLLDEVEAALDDTNIGRFVELLRRYSDRAQFIVVTHQKRTMEAADVLYGVTMGGDGVSQVVSRRLPRDENRADVAASAA